LKLVTKKLNLSNGAPELLLEPVELLVIAPLDELLLDEPVLDELPVEMVPPSPDAEDAEDAEDDDVAPPPPLEE